MEGGVNLKSCVLFRLDYKTSHHGFTYDIEIVCLSVE